MKHCSADIPMAPSVRVHHAVVPGRTRLRLENVSAETRSLSAVLHALARHPKVRRVSANRNLLSILVEHEPDVPSESIAEVALSACSGKAMNDAEGFAGRDGFLATDASNAWYGCSVDAVLEAHGSRHSGLTLDEIGLRRALLPANLLPEPRGRMPVEIMAAQFKSLPVLLLLGSAALSVATGGLVEAVVTLAVVGLNAGIGFTTENWTEKMIRQLGRSEDPVVPVLRDGQTIEVSAQEVTVGDILILSAGVPVAADGRLIESDELAVDESVLTGESYPARKCADDRLHGHIPLPARTTMVHRGGVVSGGSGAAVVTAIGRETEIGLVQSLLGGTQPPRAPMDREIERLGIVLTIGCVAAGGVMMLMLRARGAPWLSVMRSGIALAVSAIPEGLPAIAATSKAVAARGLARRGVLVRNLSVLETAGTVDTLCLDKTGTLTQNRMAATVIHTVRNRHAIDPDTNIATPSLGPDSTALARVAVLCNDAQVRLDGEVSGSGTEAALLSLALTADFDLSGLRASAPRTDAWYRNKDRSYMATEHQAEDGLMVAVKGAPEQVLDLCSTALVGGEAKPLTSAVRKKILRQNEDMAGEGLRVLGFARTLNGTLKNGSLQDLHWLGLVGLSDPLRPGAGELIANFHRAGIRTLILTGDQAATARSLAAELKVANDGSLDVVDASTLTGLSADEIVALADRAEVFARVSPSDKLKIVQALQGSGRVVAMTGDGVNDSPALRAANIGLAMGRSGSQVAKDVADVVIANDGLEGIAKFLSRGRTAENNIRRSFRFLIGTNLSETLLLMGEAMRGVNELESPLELLWLNLVTDVFPALGLALAPQAIDVLSMPPRPADKPLFNRDELAGLGRDAGLMAAAAGIAHVIGMSRYGAGPQTRGMTLLTLSGVQLAHMLTLAPRRDPARVEGLASRWGVEAGLASSAALVAAPFVFPGLGRILGVARPGAAELAISIALSAAPLAFNAPRLLKSSSLARGAGLGGERRRTDQKADSGH